MNECIVDLFSDEKKHGKLKNGLPIAFEMASIELPSGNPAVGFLREHAITGFFIHLFGKENIELPEYGNAKGFDIKVCRKPLSIKTVTGDGNVKVIWTVDDSRVKDEISNIYRPECDIFLVRIYWGEKRPSVFYIPQSVQEQIYSDLGAENYISARTGTNHRGISIKKPAMDRLMNHESTLKLNVNRIKSGLDYTPYDRWEKFWDNQK